MKLAEQMPRVTVSGIARSLGERLRVDVATTPGRHAAYHVCSDEFAEVVGPLLREVSG